MTITFTKHDRKLITKRFQVADEKENPEQIITVLHITEMYVGQEDEQARRTLPLKQKGKA